MKHTISIPSFNHFSLWSNTLCLQCSASFMKPVILRPMNLECTVMEMIESTAKTLIATSAGPAPVNHEIEVVNACLESNGGDGVVLVAPWDPFFNMDSLSNVPLCGPKELRSRVLGQNGKILCFSPLDRLAACRAARLSCSTFGKAPKDSNSPTPPGGQANCLFIFDSDPEIDVKTFMEPKAQKENSVTPSIDNPAVDVKPKFPASNFDLHIVEGKPNLPKPQYGDTIVLDDAGTLDTSDGSDSGKEVIASHKAALENFLYTRSVAPEDLNTCFGLAEARVECWQDLIPSLQMTEVTLELRGVDHRNSPGPSPQKTSTPQRGARKVKSTKVLHPKSLQQNCLS
ncbi:hypothetical protein DFH28DRAFT_1191156 [Melampsora americana]|nr:hypothetical protein DFH28DRAFT_1191156 [Melampsora americana]